MAFDDLNTNWTYQFEGEGMNDWLDASTEPRLFSIDIRSYILVFMAMYTTSMKIVIASFALLLFFAVIGKLGYNFIIFIRLVRSKLRGKKIDSTSYLYLRRYQHHE